MRFRLANKIYRHYGEHLLRLFFLLVIPQGCLELPSPAQRNADTVAENSLPRSTARHESDSLARSHDQLDADVSLNDFYIAPVCGNGRVESDEICDDGNQSELDSCIADCQVEFPDEWSIFGDWNFTDSSFTFEYCFTNFPPNITPGED